MTEQTLITMSLAILIASIGAVEIRNLRTTSFAYLLHSIFLAAIIITYAYLMKNPTLYLWAGSCFLTKIVIIPYMLLKFVRKVPQMEFKPVIGFGPSLVIVSVLVVVFFKFFQTSVDFLAPTEAAKAEPFRSLLA